MCTLRRHFCLHLCFIQTAAQAMNDQLEGWRMTQQSANTIFLTWSPSPFPVPLANHLRVLQDTPQLLKLRSKGHKSLTGCSVPDAPAELAPTCQSPWCFLLALRRFRIRERCKNRPSTLQRLSGPMQSRQNYRGCDAASQYHRQLHGMQSVRSSPRRQDYFLVNARFERQLQVQALPFFTLIFNQGDTLNWPCNSAHSFEPIRQSITLQLSLWVTEADKQLTLALLTWTLC